MPKNIVIQFAFCAHDAFKGPKTFQVCFSDIRYQPIIRSRDLA